MNNRLESSKEANAKLKSQLRELQESVAAEKLARPDTVRSPSQSRVSVVPTRYVLTPDLATSRWSVSLL